jgi:hypothetical protein
MTSLKEGAGRPTFLRSRASRGVAEDAERSPGQQRRAREVAGCAAIVTGPQKGRHGDCLAAEYLIGLPTVRSKNAPA